MKGFEIKRLCPETLKDCDSIPCEKCMFYHFLPCGEDMLGAVLDCHIRGLFKKIEFPESK